MPYTTIMALSAFIVSLVGTKLLIVRLRESRVFADIPNERSSHHIAVPKGGGIVVITTLFIFFLATYTDRYLLLLIMMLLAGVSLLDDLVGVNPLARLMMHFFAVIAICQLEQIHLFTDFMPAWLDSAIIAVGWVWFMNLFNFMDGIDGITSSETFCISAGIAIVLAFAGQFETAIARESLIVLATISGFWWWNRYPAKIFLGDVGSIPLGFLLAYFLIELSLMGYGAAAIILPAYYIVDSSFTLLRRITQGKKPWHAHREHFYQKAAGSIKHHNVVVQMVTCLNFLLIALAHFSILYPELNLFCIILAYAAAGLWCQMFSNLAPSESDNHSDE